MLSNACKYAIRSVLFLALNAGDNKKYGVKTISEELDCPQPFLSKLLQQLTRKNLVSSTKGPKGGFFLSDDNKQNTVYDIVECIDGTSKFENCFLGLSKCNDEEPCPVHDNFKGFKKGLLKKFQDKTIEEFAENIDIKGIRYL
ncbi:RrF2 family transcriptional regulator [Aureivirga sp. CE67]|uniref:RrF2 family transcriptional regulator n=1 Tax=Aureivirga sp. CE67 TaxID=1788983 RepID=UPI0018C95F30|nr:Rrf2 family transcriptional regulator [Aureivirga sp. CE67]